MYMFISCIFVAIFTFKMYYKYTSGKCTCTTKLNNKTAVVTGANTGIGFETAKDLALRGARVILACRDPGKGTAARDRIILVTGNHNVFYKQLNLASFKSVRDFAADILQSETAIHILINNAGIGKLDNSLTEANLPMEMHTNHFGPFLLTKLLLPLVKSSAPSRIVNVSSVMHKLGTIDFDNIDKPAKNMLQHSRVYSNSKLANVLFTNKLSRDLAGTGVTVNALHPGAVCTDIFRDQPSFMRFLISLLFKSSSEGAQTTIHLAVAPELSDVSGKYFVDCVPAAPSRLAQDNELADRLWIFSEKVINLN